MSSSIVVEMSKSRVRGKCINLAKTRQQILQQCKSKRNKSKRNKSKPVPSQPKTKHQLLQGQKYFKLTNQPKPPSKPQSPRLLLPVPVKTVSWSATDRATATAATVSFLTCRAHQERPAKLCLELQTQSSAVSLTKGPQFHVYICFYRGNSAHNKRFSIFDQIK